jgi:hypothetical protein
MGLEKGTEPEALRSLDAAQGCAWRVSCNESFSTKFLRRINKRNDRYTSAFLDCAYGNARYEFGCNPGACAVVYKDYKVVERGWKDRGHRFETGADRITSSRSARDHRKASWTEFFKCVATAFGQSREKFHLTAGRGGDDESFKAGKG